MHICMYGIIKYLLFDQLENESVGNDVSLIYAESCFIVSVRYRMAGC